MVAVLEPLAHPSRERDRIVDLARRCEQRDDRRGVAEEVGLTRSVAGVITVDSAGRVDEALADRRDGVPATHRDRAVAEHRARAHVGAGSERVPRRVQRAIDEWRSVTRALRGIEPVVVLVGVLRSAPEPALRLEQRRVHPTDDVADGAVVSGLGERRVRVGVDREQLRVVLEHLLEVRFRPVASRRVSEEAALDVVVHAAARHRVERPLQHRRELGRAVTTVLVEQEAQDVHLRELRFAAEAAVLGVVLPADKRADHVDDLRRYVPRLWRARDRLLSAAVVDASLDVVALESPEIRDGDDRAVHRLGVEVRPAVHDLAVGRQERGRGPAAHVVAAVDVGALVVVDADRDVAVVDLADDVGIAVARLVHHVAPVAPHRRDPEKDRDVAFARFGERPITPLAPADLARAVRSW